MKYVKGNEKDCRMQSLKHIKRKRYLHLTLKINWLLDHNQTAFIKGEINTFLIKSASVMSFFLTILVSFTIQGPKIGPYYRVRESIRSDDKADTCPVI